MSGRDGGRHTCLDVLETSTISGRVSDRLTNLDVLVTATHV